MAGSKATIWGMYPQPLAQIIWEYARESRELLHELQCKAPYVRDVRHIGGGDYHHSVYHRRPDGVWEVDNAWRFLFCAEMRPLSKWAKRADGTLFVRQIHAKYDDKRVIL